MNERRWPEALVAPLIPPACREEVLGDFNERNPTWGRYVLDALRTVPLLIGSRIRRTWDWKLLAMYAAVLYLELFYEGRFDARWLVPDIIPCVSSWLALMVADVYVNCGRLARLRLLAFAFLAALASQVMLRSIGSDLALPWVVVTRGSLLGVIWALAIQRLYRRASGSRLGTR